MMFRTLQTAVFRHLVKQGRMLHAQGVQSLQRVVVKRMVDGHSTNNSTSLHQLAHAGCAIISGVKSGPRTSMECSVKCMTCAPVMRSTLEDFGPPASPSLSDGCRLGIRTSDGQSRYARIALLAASSDRPFFRSTHISQAPSCRTIPSGNKWRRS